MSNVKFTPEDFDRACSLLPAETCWGEHLTPEIVLHIAQASRRAALKEVAAQWDGCIYHGIGEDIDIGSSIRNLATETNNG